MKPGDARIEAIVGLVPPGGVIVDVGADHGSVAERIGGIATERHPRRRSGRVLPWVVADGLAPFRHVDTAVIAGMGARTIAAILDRGPTPRCVVLHADDEPSTLRGWLAERGWQIDAEALAPQGRRYAEVIRAVSGVEAATGLWLHHGPRLLQSDDPHLVPHLQAAWTRWSDLHRRLVSVPSAAARREEAREHADFLAARLRERGVATAP